tara:strand:+ start:3427 stop:3759 length:333 start_codon:yes stop_codon:yes gene_type:complete
MIYLVLFFIMLIIFYSDFINAIENKSKVLVLNMDLDYNNAKNVKSTKLPFIYNFFSKHKDSNMKRDTKIEKINKYLELRIKELEIDKKYLQESYNLLLAKYQVIHEFAFE